MSITVVIATFHVPYAKVVKSTTTFTGEDAVKCATDFINAESAKWLEETIGDDDLNEAMMEDWSYDPITELGPDGAEYQLWEGDASFEAILDEASQKALHDAHYKRKFTDKDIAQGKDCSAEIAEVQAFYAGPKH